jgi:hypothetical protein
MINILFACFSFLQFQRQASRYQALLMAMVQELISGDTVTSPHMERDHKTRFDYLNGKMALGKYVRHHPY